MHRCLKFQHFVMIFHQCVSVIKLLFDLFVHRNVIDVAALDSHNLQQHEYLERKKIYNMRIQQVNANSRTGARSKCLLLQDVPSAEEWIDRKT